jgi:ribosome-associated toxin RatA of RatAB toxin-antitoxin module
MGVQAAWREGLQDQDLSFDYAGPLVRATLGPLFNQAANTLVDAFCQRAKQNAELKR